jgi:hypothetical protein
MQGGSRNILVVEKPGTQTESSRGFQGLSTRSDDDHMNALHHSLDLAKVQRLRKGSD